MLYLDLHLLTGKPSSCFCERQLACCMPYLLCRLHYRPALELLMSHAGAECSVCASCLHRVTSISTVLQLWYGSRRFNLLREENEGFSKMLVRLQSFGKEAAAQPENVDQMVPTSHLSAAVLCRSSAQSCLAAGLSDVHSCFCGTT